MSVFFLLFLVVGCCWLLLLLLTGAAAVTGDAAASCCCCCSHCLYRCCRSSLRAHHNTCLKSDPFKGNSKNECKTITNEIVSALKQLNLIFFNSDPFSKKYALLFSIQTQVVVNTVPLDPQNQGIHNLLEDSFECVCLPPPLALRLLLALTFIYVMYNCNPGKPI